MRHSILNEQISYMNGAEKKTLSLESILECTAGGQGIGASIIRNLNRLKYLPTHGWITKGKLQKIIEKETPQLEKLKKHTLENLEELKKLPPGAMRNITELEKDSELAEQIEEISSVLFWKYSEVTEKAHAINLALKNEMNFGTQIGTTESILRPEGMKFPDDEGPNGLNFQFNRDAWNGLRYNNFKIENTQVQPHKGFKAGLGEIPWKKTMPLAIQDYLGHDEEKLRNLAVLSLQNTTAITSYSALLSREFMVGGGCVKFQLQKQDGSTYLRVGETYICRDPGTGEQKEWWNTTLTYNLDDLKAPVYLKKEKISKQEFDQLAKEFDLLLKASRQNRT